MHIILYNDLIMKFNFNFQVSTMGKLKIRREKKYLQEVKELYQFVTILYNNLYNNKITVLNKYTNIFFIL